MRTYLSFLFSNFLHSIQLKAKLKKKSSFFRHTLDLDHEVAVVHHVDVLSQDHRDVHDQRAHEDAVFHAVQEDRFHALDLDHLVRMKRKLKNKFQKR